jgi:hypothetical protein
MFAFRGVDTVNPFDVADAYFHSDGAAVTSYDIPTQTPVTDQAAAIIHTWSNTAATQTWTPPSGYTEVWDSGGTACQQEVAYKLALSIAATGTRSAVRSGTGTKGGGMGVILRPAGALTSPRFKRIVGGVWTPSTHVKHISGASWVDL